MGESPSFPSTIWEQKEAATTRYPTLIKSGWMLWSRVCRRMISRLPPPNRRLVVQASIGKQEITRVYDRANAPDQVLEVLRLSQAHIPSWVLKFEPKNHWSAHAQSTDGALAQSANGLIVSAGDGGPFKFWDPDRRELLNEAPNTPLVVDQMEMSQTIRGIVFSPSGSVAAVEGLGFIDLRDAALAHRIRVLAEPLVGNRRYGLSNPQFTSDGKYLIVRSDQPALRVYDAQTWERVPAAPGMPDGALAFYPAASGQTSVYLSSSGEIALWSSEGRRNIAVLDDKARLERVAYSPDESMVATVTALFDPKTGDDFQSGFGARKMVNWSTSCAHWSKGHLPSRDWCGGRTASMYWQRRGPTGSGATTTLESGALKPDATGRN